MRAVITVVTLLLAIAPGFGATLEKLSLEDMIEKSTMIVRAKVAGERAVQRGRVIYTLTNVSVLEHLKGPRIDSVEVATPGGAVGGLRQEFSGVPELLDGKEYVLFLWEGNNGLTHVIGLSQGVFTLDVDEEGRVVVHRAASDAVMLDPKTGQPMQDGALTLALRELRERVQVTLGGARQ